MCVWMSPGLGKVVWISLSVKWFFSRLMPAARPTSLTWFSHFLAPFYLLPGIQFQFSWFVDLASLSSCFQSKNQKKDLFRFFRCTFFCMSPAGLSFRAEQRTRISGPSNERKRFCVPKTSECQFESGMLASGKTRRHQRERERKPGTGVRNEESAWSKADSQTQNRSEMWECGSGTNTLPVCISATGRWRQKEKKLTNMKRSLGKDMRWVYAV